MIVSAPKVNEATKDLKTILLSKKDELEKAYADCQNIKICAKIVYVELDKFMGSTYRYSPKLVEKIRIYADFEAACSDVLLS